MTLLSMSEDINIFSRKKENHESKFDNFAKSFNQCLQTDSQKLAIRDNFYAYYMQHILYNIQSSLIIQQNII